MADRKRFYEKMNSIIADKNVLNNFYINSDKYSAYINEVKEAKQVKSKKAIHYRRLKRFDVINVGGGERLIVPVNPGCKDILYYVDYDNLYDVIHQCHLATGHGGRTKTLKEANRKYKNVTVEAITQYLQLCESCQKKSSMPKKGLVVRPILHTEMNSRCQIDLIDMQSNPDNHFKFIMVYQDHLTKFVVLRAIRTKRAEEIAYNLLDIFTLFGAPSILHSDNGREFANAIISELCQLWEGVKIVHGKPRHSQSQGSVERANQDIQNMIATWMETNKSKKWSESLRFVQAMKNNSYHEGIKQSPYEAMFGCKMKMGLCNSNIPSHILPNLNSEEDLEKVLSEDQEAVEEDSSDLPSFVNETNNPSDNPDMNQNDMLTVIEENGGAPDEIENNLESQENETKTSNIKRNREEAHRSLEQQAKKMKIISSKRFPPATRGQTVKVKIPEVDRSKTDPRILLAVVLEKTDEDFYRLGTSTGTLAQLFARNQFAICKENFLSPGDVPPQEISVRSAVRKLSLCGGQGFKKCNCTRKCSTKKCLCRSSNILCNSKCHGSLSCTNK